MSQRIHAHIPGASVYMVGGAVRDSLLGLPVQDHDWVVVGATPEAMVQQGYVPVGKDFPVFLHPQTHEEHALARTERKTARGYKGFAVFSTPDVTLEQDLARRDLTINAIARDEEGHLIDPFHGQQDLQHKVLRHVTGAFAEDPVRILRLARFAARFADFTVAPETMALMRHMVHDGEVDHLVAERVWQELSRGLMEQHPARMLEVLRECGALTRILPEVDALWGVPQRADTHPEVDTGAHLLLVLTMAARLQTPLDVRFACLTHDLGKATTAADALPRHPGHEERGLPLLRALCQRLRVPADCRRLAEVVVREHGAIHACQRLGAQELVLLLERCDAFRQPQRFAHVLQACECDGRGRLGHAHDPYPPRDWLWHALQDQQALALGSIAQEVQQQMQEKRIRTKEISVYDNAKKSPDARPEGLGGELIRARITEVRCAQMQQWVSSHPYPGLAPD